MDEPGAIWIPNSNAFPGRDGQTPRWIILHGTAGGTSAQAIASYFRGTEGSNNPVSATYVIGQDGQFCQCNSERDGAWANGVIKGISGVATPDSGDDIRDAWWTPDVNPNDVTISIEHCKPDLENQTPLTDAQKQTSFTLIKHICQRWNIPMRKADANGGITGHYSIDPVDKSHCPGPYPWDELFAFLQEGLMITLATPGVSTYFTGDAQHWHCPATGKDVANGMLTFYQSFGGSGLCGLTHLGLPLSNELGLGNGRTIQFFERGVLVFDPGHTNDTPPGAIGPVYVAHIDKGPGMDPRIAQLQAQLQAAQQQLAQSQNNQQAQHYQQILQQIHGLSTI